MAAGRSSTDAEAGAPKGAGDARAIARAPAVGGGPRAVGTGSQAPLPASGQTDRAFAETDRNRDGRIDREEFHRRTVEVFYFLDTNRDGFLVVEEIRTTVTLEAFRAADPNGDGQLSLQEYLNARFRDFAVIDANGDGVITREELEATARSAGSAR
jgi:Ca2+-binding EF-hand superfamily protein